MKGPRKKRLTAEEEAAKDLEEATEEEAGGTAASSMEFEVLEDQLSDELVVLKNDRVWPKMDDDLRAMILKHEKREIEVQTKEWWQIKCKVQEIKKILGNE